MVLMSSISLSNLVSRPFSIRVVAIPWASMSRTRLVWERAFNHRRKAPAGGRSQNTAGVTLSFEITMMAFTLSGRKSTGTPSTSASHMQRKLWQEGGRLSYSRHPKPISHKWHQVPQGLLSSGDATSLQHNVQPSHARSVEADIKTPSTWIQKTLHSYKALFSFGYCTLNARL